MKEETGSREEEKQQQTSQAWWREQGQMRSCWLAATLPSRFPLSLLPKTTNVLKQQIAAAALSTSRSVLFN